MFKKVMFYLGIALTLLATFSATTLQILPFIIFLVLAGITIYGNKDLRLWILVLASLMLTLNTFVLFSLVDIIYWGLVVLAFAKK